MGACFVDYTLSSDLSKDDVREKVKLDIREAYQDAIYDAQEDGGEYEGYSGTLAEKEGVSFLSQSFDDVEEAKEYILEHNDKWGPVDIAQTKDGTWVVGGWCSS